MTQIWPPPPNFPPPIPSLPSYHVFVHAVRAGSIVPLDTDAVFLVDASSREYHANHYNPHYGSGVYSWQKMALPFGRYRLRIRLSQVAGGFYCYADPATGALVQDPTWTGCPVEGEPRPPIIVELRLPDDAQCRCAIGLDCPHDGASGIVDGRLWASSTPLTAGPAAGVPAELERYFRGRIPPGEHTLRLEHPRYVLPPATPPLSANASLLVRRVQVTLAPTPEPPPPEMLRIDSASFYLDVNEVREFRTNVPAAQAAQVQWGSTAPQVLQPYGAPNRFRGLSRGVATVKARYRNLEASATVVVRRDSSESVQQPVDPTQIVHDPWTGARVVAGQVVCAFKPDVGEPQQLSLIEELHLQRLGVLAGTGAYQLGFDPTQWSLQQLVERLNSDPRVEAACPHLVMDWSTIPSYVPSDALLRRPWHLAKMEAYAAFGVMKAIEREPQHVVFIDSGIWVSAADEPHVDFRGRFVLNRCGNFIPSTPVCPASFRDLLDPNPPQGTSSPHGNTVIGTAAAQWDNTGAVGIDPAMRIALCRCEPSVFQTRAALDRIRGWIVRGFRIVNMTTVADVTSTTVYNKWYAARLRAIVQAGGLVVIAAGNDNKGVQNIALASIKPSLESDQAAVLVVGGTAVAPLDQQGPETRWNEDPKHGSNYGTDIDIAAPAYDILSTGADDNITVEAGTSLAAPQVSAVAAVVLSILPDEPAAEVKKILVNTSDRFPDSSSVPARLSTEPGRPIGIGRVNLWQSVLYAVNKRAQGTEQRYVGLRITADQKGLDLLLAYADGSNAEPLPEKSVLNRPTGTDATRVTLTNAVGHKFPEALVARKSGSAKDLYRQTLRLTTARIDALKDRYVITLRMYTGGRVELARDPQGTLPSNRARFTIANKGTAPADAELLDPVPRSPWDKSLRPWMKLADGDSFAPSLELAATPPGLAVEFLDKLQKPFPQEHIEEGVPFVRVPFGASDAFHMRVTAPATSVAAGVQGTVRVVSLNNRAVVAEVPWSWKPAVLQMTEDESFLNGPVRWWKIGALRIRNAGTGPARLSLSFSTKPPAWAWGAGMDMTLNPGEERREWVRFGPHGDAPVGTKGACFVRGENPDAPGATYAMEFPAIVGEPPQVVVTPAALHADSVRPAPATNLVFAEWPVQIENRSAYPVRVVRDFWRVTGTPATPPRGWLQLVDFFGASNARTLRAGERVACTLRVSFDRALAVPPGATPATAKHTIAILLPDPHGEYLQPPIPPPADNKDYTAQPISTEVVLRMAP